MSMELIGEDCRWYVGAVRSVYVNDVVKKLKDLRFETFLPLYRRVGGMVDTMLYPGYLFICLELTVHNWISVLGVNGFIRFLGKEDRPMPLADEVVDGIRMLVGPDGVLRERVESDFDKYKPGDLVVVSGGPFDGRGGIVVWTDKKGAKINLSPLLGVGLGLYSPYLQLRSLSEADDDIAPKQQKMERGFNPYKRKRYGGRGGYSP